MLKQKTEEMQSLKETIRKQQSSFSDSKELTEMRSQLT